MSSPKVCVAMYDGLCTFEFGIAYEIFGLPRPEMGENWYRYGVSCIEEGPIRANSGVEVKAEFGLEALDGADIIIIPGWRSIDAEVPADFIDAIRREHARGARIVSLCSGIAVLAAAGLLDGKRATTHWRYVDAVKSRYPEIELVEDLLYIDEGTILTAAGSAAGIDLCLHVVRTDFGAEAANKVARRLVIPSHRDGGQTQFIPKPVIRSSEATRLGKVMDWARQNLDKALSVDQLADRSGMSKRTLHRRMVEASGFTPGDWIAQERVALAQYLLETSPDLSIEAIADSTGLGSADNLRVQFRRRVGISPTQFRRQFRVAS